MVVAACLPICWAGMRTFGKALIGRTTVGHGLDLEAMRNVAPGLIVALIHIFWAAMALGFYTASTITFFIPVSRYNLAPNNDP